MENSIVISATSKGATIILNYNDRVYTQTLLPTESGAKYIGYSFSNFPEIPLSIVEELDSFVAYDLMNCIIR
jgi:hypothetical protein